MICEQHPPNTTLLVTTILSSALLVGVIVSCMGPVGPDGEDAMLPDSLSPVIEWIAPEPGIIIDTAHTLSTIAFDLVGDENGQTSPTMAWKVAFFIGGREFPAELADSTEFLYVYHWKAAHYPEAPYPLQARVWDLARNHTDTPVVMVYVRH